MSSRKRLRPTVPSPVVQAALSGSDRDPGPGNAALQAMIDQGVGPGASEGEMAEALMADATQGASMRLPYLDQMEAAFGTDLSQLEVFHAPQLEEAGRGAAASGNRLVFGTTTPSPEMVGHEIAHTLQQGEAGGLAPRVGGSAEEGEADEVGRAAARGERVAVRGSAAAGVAFWSFPGAGTLGSLWDSATEAVGSAWDSTTDVVGTVWDRTTDAVGTVWDSTTDAVGGAWDSATTWAGEAWDSTTDVVGTVWDRTTDAVGYVWDSTNDAVGSGLNWAREEITDVLGTDLGPGLINWQDGDGNTYSLLSWETDRDGSDGNVGGNFDLFRTADAQGRETTSLGGLNFNLGEDGGGLAIDGALFSSRDEDGAMLSIGQGGFAVGDVTDDQGTRTTGLSLGGGLARQVDADGNVDDILGLGLVAGDQQRANGTRTSGLALNGGVWSHQGADGSNTSLLGVDALIGRQVYQGGASRSGVSLQGGVYHDQDADGSQFSVLGLDGIIGHETYQGGGQTSGVDLGLGLIRSDDLGDGSKFGLLSGELMAGWQVGADGQRTGGLDLDLGLLNWESRNGGDLDVLGLDGFLGYRDNEQGQFTAGFQGDLGLLSAKTPDWFLGGNANLLSGGLEITASDQSFKVDPRLSGADVGLSGKTWFNDPNSDTDENFGLSKGLGISAPLPGFELFYGDIEGDGNRDWGFGLNIDAIPFGFSARSEDPVRTLISTASPMGPGLRPFLPEENMTDQAVEGLGAAWDAASGLFGGQDPGPGGP